LASSRLGADPINGIKIELNFAAEDAARAGR
jgi:hypothetical protein